MSNNYPQQHDNLSSLEKAIQKHLSEACLSVSEDHLLQKSLNHLIYEKQVKALLPKVWASVCFLAGSFVLLVTSALFSWHAFGQTPTHTYFSLMFSDFGEVARNWQDYSLSILESLPLGAVAFLLSALLASAWLIDFSANQLSHFHKLTEIQHYGDK